MSDKKFGPDRFSRFDVYWIQTNKHPNKQTDKPNLYIDAVIWVVCRWKPLKYQKYTCKFMPQLWKLRLYLLPTSLPKIIPPPFLHVRDSFLQRLMHFFFLHGGGRINLIWIILFITFYQISPKSLKYFLDLQISPPHPLTRDYGYYIYVSIMQLGLDAG